MQAFWLTVAFSLLGGVGVVLGASVMLMLADRHRRWLLTPLVSFAAGALLGAAFLGLVPEALEAAAPRAILAAVLAGVVLFALFERLILWRHGHESAAEHRAHHHPAGPMILIGDSFHNFVDGIAIAAAFLTSIPLGISTALAVVFHEVPQEVGDFAVLLESGYTRRRALAFNVLSALASLAGALIAWFALPLVAALVPYVLAIAAASFIYIAIADLIPMLHRHSGASAGLGQFVLMIAGIGVMVLLREH